MHPLDPLVDYGITERSYLDIGDVQLELLPDKVRELRRLLKLLRMWLKAPIIETDEKGKQQARNRGRKGSESVFARVGQLLQLWLLSERPPRYKPLCTGANGSPSESKESAKVRSTERDESRSLPRKLGFGTFMMESLQESQMRENRTSGSMRGSNGKGIACNRRPLFSTLLSWCLNLFSEFPHGLDGGVLQVALAGAESYHVGIKLRRVFHHFNVIAEGAALQCQLRNDADSCA